MAVEDGLLMSTPEAFLNEPGLSAVRRFKLWTWKTCLQNGGIELHHKMWKGFCLNILKAFLGDTPRPVIGGTIDTPIQMMGVSVQK